MSMARMDKWIPGISPDDRISDVAGRTLRFRLAAVQHYLPLAAKKPEEDIEYVHELRVATRRTTAALRLYAAMLPRRRTVRMKTRLKQIRRAAGDARDYDVLAQRLARERPEPEAKCLLEDVRGQRRKAQKPILALHRRLEREDRFEWRIAQLLRGIRPRGKKKTLGKNPRFGDWARASLRPLVRRFFKAARTIEKHTAALHQFRIRGKKLRYAMEMLAGAFPPQFREKLYPVIEDLQAKLGEINDHVTEQARLRQRIEADEDAAEVNYLQNLLRQENDYLEQDRQELLSWWTPNVQESLRAGFDELLVACPEPVTIGRPNPPRRKRSRQ